MGNHYGESGEKLSKPDMCKKIGAKILIDDSLLYAQECAKEGIKTILFGNYPWYQNKHDLHENIKRVEGWHEVDKVIFDVIE